MNEFWCKIRSIKNSINEEVKDELLVGIGNGPNELDEMDEMDTYMILKHI